VQQPQPDTRALPERQLVSVMVPVYNVECYLQQCVDSILVQDYDNLDVILLDDGSTDGCQVLLRPQLSAARNVDIDRATGDWALTVAASRPSKPCAKREQKHLSTHVMMFRIGTSTGRRGVRLRMPSTSNGVIAVRRMFQIRTSTGYGMPRAILSTSFRNQRLGHPCYAGYLRGGDEHAAPSERAGISPRESGAISFVKKGESRLRQTVKTRRRMSHRAQMEHKRSKTGVQTSC